MPATSLQPNANLRRDFPSTSLRVALVSPSWPPTQACNGIVTYVDALRTGLRAQGHTPIVVSTAIQPGDFDDIINLHERDKKSLRIRVGERFARLMGNSGNLRIAPVMGRKIAKGLQRRKQAQQCHILEMEESFGTAYWSQRHLNIPVVVRLHGPWFLTGPANGVAEDAELEQRIAAEGRAIANAAGVTAPSQSVLDSTRVFYDLPLEHAAVIPNPARSRPAVAWSEEKADPWTILFVGRFDLLKGGDLVILAFQNIWRHYPQAKLLFVGPDRGISTGNGEQKGIEQFVRENVEPGCARSVSWLGHQPPERVMELRTDAWATLVASRFETFSYTALEALAQGCPTIGTRVGGIPEIIRHGETGLLVEPGSADSLAAGVMSLFEDRELAARLGHSAARDSQLRFSPQTVAEQTVEYYRDVLDRWETRKCRS